MTFGLFAKFSLVLAFSLFAGLTCGPKAIQALEIAISGAIGAIVGGVLSALAFAFVIMSKLTKEALAVDNSNKVQVNSHHNKVTSSLLFDVRTLIWCLAAAIFLPVYREMDIPFVQMPIGIAEYLSKSQLVTGLEIFLVLVSISVLFEVCSCMFQNFIADSSPNQQGGN